MDGHMRGKRTEEKEKEEEGENGGGGQKRCLCYHARSNYGQKYNMNWRKEDSSSSMKEVSYRKEKLVLSEITG